MGKIQSKRSVDITIEGNKTREEDVTGKLGKIEDLSQRSHEDNCNVSLKKFTENKKANSDGSEYKTYSNPEKCADIQPETVVSNETKDHAGEENSTKEEAISPITDEIKSKKDKVKKKWSFRSVSFGKKDKQKPCKTEEMTSILTNEVAGNQTFVGCDAIENYQIDESSIDSQDKNSYDEQKLTSDKMSDNVLTDISISLKNKNYIPANTTAKITGTVECSNNKNINEMNELTVPLPLDIKLSSEKVNDNRFTNTITDECEMNTNTNLIHSCIGINTDGVKNVTLMNINELDTAVDNSKNSNGILNTNQCDIIGNLNYMSHAPPLPCSPPPYQVPIVLFSSYIKPEFAKSDDIILKSEEIGLKSPSAEGSYVKIEKKKNEYNNPQEHSNTVEYQVTQNENITEEIVNNVMQNNYNNLEISFKKIENSHELIKQIEISPKSLNGNNAGLKERNLLNISSFPQSHITSKGNANVVYNEICEYQSQQDQQIATTIVDEISETALIINEDQNKEDY